jgi:hypothetical protein
MCLHNNTKSNLPVTRSPSLLAQVGSARVLPRLGCVGLGLLLSTGAMATVTVNITSADLQPDGTYRADVALDQNVWLDFSSDCSTVSPGSTCSLGDLPDPNPNNLLFSWGTKDAASADGPLNSFMQVNFGSGVDFKLDSIAFETPNPSEELGPPGGPASPSLSPSTGRGTMVAYEVNLNILNPNTANTHQVTDQLMDIHASYTGGSGPATKSVTGWKVAVSQGTASGRSSGAASTTDYFDSGGIVPYALSDANQSYFFTDSGAAETTDDNKDTSLRFTSGDQLEFQFYEEAGFWDYFSLLGDTNNAPPDAYYGSFEIIITPFDEPESTLSVTANQTLADLRAGDTATSTGSLTASNQGEAGSGLSGSFAALTSATPGATDQIVADDDPNPPDTPLAFGPLAQGADAQRDYTFSADTVVFDASDAGSTGKVFTVTQDVTSDADTDPNQSRTLTGTVKGPILGVSELSAPNVADPADWIAYDGGTGAGDTINLGTIEVGDDFLLKELTLANLFGADEGLLSLLTFYNVGVVNLTGSFFSLDPSDPGPSGGTALQVGDPNLSLTIRFDPDDTDIGTWTGRLDFSTDQNRAQNICGGSSACPGALTLSFNLQATLTPAAPVPGVLALLAVGAVPLLMARRRRTRGQRS